MKHTRIIPLLTLALWAAACLSACGGGQAAEPVHLAVAAGVHANAGDIQADSETITGSLYRACYGYRSGSGSVTMIRVDGSPQVVFQSAIPVLKTQGLDQAKLDQIARGYADQLQAALGEIRAQTGEVDVLKSLELASQALAGKEGEKLLLVLDPGLPTAGYLDLARDPGWLEADPRELADALTAEAAIPDLEGVDVCWCYCGQTAPPQPELSQRQKDSLMALWEAVLRAGGAASVTFAPDFAGLPLEGLPAVSLVEAGERTLSYTPMETIVLDAGQVEFIGDTARYADEAAAAAALERVAGDLLAHPDNRVLLVGSTATGANAGFCDELSRARAAAVAESLRANGVPDSQIAGVLGLGYRDPWHIDDLDASGRQIEALARQNRKVLILDAAGEDAARVSGVG